MPDTFSSPSLRWGIAETEAERDEVYAFRYAHYFHRLSDAPGVDHAMKRVYSPHDETSVHLTGRAGNGELLIVGTGTRACTPCLPEEWATILHLDRLTPLGLDNILLYSRLVEHTNHRGGPVFPGFFKYSAHYFVARGYAYSIHYCAPALVPLYERLGYRRYGHGHTLHSGLFRLPMILAGADTAHNNRVNPAFAKAVRDLDAAGDLALFHATLPELANPPLCALNEAERLAKVRRILAENLPGSRVEERIPDAAAKSLRRASLLELRAGESPAHSDDPPLIWFLLAGEARLLHADGGESAANPGNFINGHALAAFTVLSDAKVLAFAPGRPDPAPGRACLTPEFWTELF